MIRTRTILAFGLVAAAAAGLVFSALSISRSNTPGETTAAPAADASTPRRIGALGTVEAPGGTIRVAPAANGVVAEVAVAPGGVVKAGDLLFKLDDRLARARVQELARSVISAEAALAEAQGSLPVLLAEVDAARAALEATEVQLADANEELASAESLAQSSGAISRREVGRRRTARDAAAAQLAQATARLAQVEAEAARLDPDRDGSRLLPLRSAVAGARAALSTADIELEILSARSPVDATVLEVNVRPGQFATTSSPEGSVSLGATGPLQVRAQIEEADLPLLADDAPAVGYLRGAATEAIPLTFIRREPLLRPKSTLAGDSAERIDTRVIEVIYEVDADADLLPGQLIDVLIDVDAESGAEE